MIEFLLMLIIFGLLDSLNPFSIGLQIILLPLVKKKYDAIWYITGVFLTNLIGGLIIYTGIDIIIENLFSEVDFSAMPYPLVQFGFGILLFTYIIIEIFTKRKNKIPIEKYYSITPFSLLFLGVSGTLFELPTALPYLAILEKATELQLSILQLLPLLVLYCIIYLLPMLIIQITFIIAQEKILPKLLRIKTWFDRYNKIIIICICSLLALLLIIDSIFSFSGNSFIW